MRAKTLILVWTLTIALTSASSAQSRAPNTSSSPYATLHFATKDGTACEIAVRDSVRTSEQQTLTISCGRKNIFRYSTPDHILDISRDSFDGDRFFARWEGTTLTHLTVFQVEINQLRTKATVVFDESSEFMPDILSPDEILVSGGKRIVGDEMLPVQTDVFKWIGGKYEHRFSWKWREDMRYEDRFCVLDPQRLSCPVTPYHGQVN